MEHGLHESREVSENIHREQQEDQKETRFVFDGELFPCREGNRISLGLIGRGVLVARNYATNRKVIVNKPESFFQINPPDFSGRFYGLLAAFFLLWFLSLGALAARSAPFGTYKSPLTRAIDDALASFVCFSLIVVPVIIYIVVSKKSRQFYKLERARQSQEIKDIISNF
jgi:hypothetical protein